MKHSPPRWADRFLAWYCRPDLLEGIQGDLHEIFEREIEEHPRTSRLRFVWNVIRFFRLRNIRKINPNHHSIITAAMIRNIFTVYIRNFVRRPGSSVLSIFGLTAGFMCAFLIMLWSMHQFSYDDFHRNISRVYKVITHVESEGNVQTYDVAAVNIDLSSIPEVISTATICTGSRWPNELCFRPENKPNECVYFNGVYANPELFDVLTFEIVEGDRHPLKKGQEIAISQTMAKALYGDASPVGKTFKVDGTLEVTIVSVFKNTPSNSSLYFEFVMSYDILKKLWGTDEEQFNENFFQVYALTNKTTTASILSEKLNHVEVLTEEYKNQKIRYEAVPFGNWHLNSKYENGQNAGGKIEYVRLFMIIGALVVIMAIINFVNLSTARATLRSKEIGIRKVHGAIRGAIIVQFMSESFFSVFISFVLAGVGTQLILPAFNTMIHEQLSMQMFDAPMLPYLGGFLIAVSLLAGLYPSIVYSSFQPLKILRGLFSKTSTGSIQLRKVLMTVQLCISITIMVFTAVLFLQIRYINGKDLGFDKDNTIRVEPTWTLLKSYDAFKTELLKDDAITAVAASNANPLDVGGGNTGVSWKGKPQDARISFKTIGSMYDFPELLGLKLLEGRGFIRERGGVDSIDTDVLVSKEAAKVMGLKNPLGEKIKIGDRSCTIVGIVNDFHTESLRRSQEPVILYQVGIRQLSAIYVKYKSGQVKQAMETLQSKYAAIENSFSMRYWFQDDTFHELYRTENIALNLVVIFTAIAFIIAIIGIVGLATFNVMRKTKEISIRRVMGASASQSIALLASEFTWIIVAAVAISLPLVWFVATQWLTSFSYHISTPWWIYFAAPSLIVFLTICIIWVLGLKTVNANPTEVLRTE